MSNNSTFAIYQLFAIKTKKSVILLVEWVPHIELESSHLPSQKSDHCIGIENKKTDGVAQKLSTPNGKRFAH